MSVKTATIVLAAAIAMAPLRAQPPSPRPEFEVATVKRSPPPAGDTININLGNIRNGKLTFGNASLSDCLKFAYGITSDAQLSGPDWIKSKEVRFDIVAPVPPDTERGQVLLMLQALLTDRLKLAVHREQKELPFYALVPGKNGAKIHEAGTDAAGSGGNVTWGGRIISQLSMPTLATLLSRFERVTVVDMTGLKGLYDVKLEWTVDDTRSQPSPEAGPSIYTAVQEQLGLKLESRKGPLEVLVVDHAEKIPADN